MVKTNVRSLLYLVFMCALFMCACAAPQRRSAFDGLFEDSAFAGARWGAVVKSLDTGEIIYSRDEMKSFIPASNMKLFTTAAALLNLGPDYRYRTGLYTNGEIKDGVLHGDLFVRGSGDPSLSIKDFEKWAETLAASGVKEIRGDLLGDAFFFDDVRLGAGWSWEDESFSYASQISGLAFNENSIEVDVMPGPIGGPAVVRVNPQSSYVSIINEAITVPAVSDRAGEPLRFFRMPGSNNILVEGEIPFGAEEINERLSVDDPALFAATVLREVVESRGIDVAGRPSVIRAGDEPYYDALTEIATSTSPPLSEIIMTMNKFSRNIYAEQLFKTLGKVVAGDGSAGRSAEVVRDSLGSIGIPLGGMEIYDGSGLSRLNLATPLQIVTLLEFMAKHEYFHFLYDSLPIAGVDGTLRRKFINTPAANNLRGKTGYFRQTSALSGYMRTNAGELVVFSLMINNYLGRSTHAALQERFIEALSKIESRSH